jgi:uncharacterized phage infection (PIP) family protein YhgE
MNMYGYGTLEDVLQKLERYSRTLEGALASVKTMENTGDTVASQLSSAAEQHADSASLFGRENVQGSQLRFALQTMQTKLKDTTAALASVDRDLDDRIRDLRYALNRAE